MTANESLEEIVKSAAVDRDGHMTLSCPAAFHIAEKHSTDLSEIGALCNELGIKIVKCQLGCFG